MPAVVYVVLHVALSIFVPSANLLVMVVICQLKKRSSRNYIFILNLAAADLLVGVMCIGDALDDATDTLFEKSQILCLLRICMGVTPCIGSILTLFLISLDRYLAVKLPLHYPFLMSKKRIVLSLVVLWVLSILVGHLPLIFSELRQSEYRNNCELSYATQSDYLYIICFGIFIPALLTLIYLHISIGRIAYLQHKQIHLSCIRAGSPIVHLCYFKALKTILIVIVCFVVSWGPYYVTAFVEASCESCNLGSLFRVFSLLGETNSLINPFVYSLYDKDIRTEFNRLIKCKSKGQITSCKSIDLAVANCNTRT